MNRELRLKLEMNKEHNHMVFRRQISRKLKEIIQTNYAENMKCNLPKTQKKTRKMAARGVRSIRVKSVSP